MSRRFELIWHDRSTVPAEGSLTKRIEPIRILHVIASLDPAKGGPQAVVENLSLAQASLGHRVAVASYAAGSETTFIAPETLVGVDLHLLPQGDAVERLTASRMAGALCRLVPKFDVLHLHGVWEPLLLRAAWVARQASKPYLVQPHGMLDPWSLSQGTRKKRLALLLAHRRLLNRAARIVTLNADEARLIRPLGLTAGTVTIANGVSLPTIDAQSVPGQFRAAHPELGGGPFIMFLGRLHHKKGLDVLAEAFRLLAARRPDLHLVAAGPEAGAGDVLRQAAHASGLGDRVHIVGGLFGARKFEALADAACFCLPSRQEGFSVAVLEALSCGLPVAISEECHFPEVELRGAGRVVSLDPSAFAGAIEDILRNPDAAAKMGTNGRRLVAERYTWSRIAVDTIRAYAAAAQTHGSVASGTGVRLN